jgi:hypothetical protein
LSRLRTLPGAGRCYRQPIQKTPNAWLLRIARRSRSPTSRADLFDAQIKKIEQNAETYIDETHFKIVSQSLEIDRLKAGIARLREPPAFLLIDWSLYSKRSVKAPDQAALRSRSAGRQCHGSSSEICRAG